MGADGPFVADDSPAGPAGQSGDRQPLNLVDAREPITPERLTQWFETVISVQRAAAGSAEFYEETAQAVVQLVGLDGAQVLLRARQRLGSRGQLCAAVGQAAGITAARRLRTWSRSGARSFARSTWPRHKA